jgi:hypothetical protein
MQIYNVYNFDIRFFYLVINSNNFLFHVSFRVLFLFIEKKFIAFTDM